MSSELKGKRKIHWLSPDLPIFVVSTLMVLQIAFCSETLTAAGHRADKLLRFFVDSLVYQQIMSLTEGLSTANVIAHEGLRAKMQV